MRNFATILILAGTSLLIGCQQAAVPDPGTDAAAALTVTDSPAGKIGTINIQRIYMLLGLQQQRAEKDRVMRKELDSVVKQQTERIQEKLEEYGGDRDKLDDEQKKEMRQLEVEHDTAVRRTGSEIQQQLAEFNRYLNNVFAERTREPIRKVAERRSLDVVMILQPNMFAYVKPTVDITDDVIKEIGMPATPAGTPGSSLPGPATPGLGLPAKGAPSVPAADASSDGTVLPAEKDAPADDGN